tara:strand:- start:8375 stop:8878 length:504 start_codon:yes stop_codon:yes gene_type:complete
MCDPVTMATLAVVSGIGEYQAASEATKSYNRQADANNLNATNARDLKVRQLDLQTQQELANSQQEKLDSQLEIMRTTAKAEVAGAAAGVSGNSLNTITNEFTRRGLMTNTVASTEQNNAFAAQAVNNQAIHSEALGRLMTKKAKPSALLAAVKTGVSAATAYEAFNT